MRLDWKRAGAAATMLTTMLAALGCSPAAQPTAEPTVEPAAQTPAPAFVAEDFDVPTQVEADGFTIVPLGPDLAEIDYEAYMSSIEHLQATFTRSTSWPRADLDADDAIKDMETEAARFEARTSFAYAVLTPDGSRERGCIYVYPSDVAGYDAVVRLWVTQAEFDAGFDEELYAFAQEWIATQWPFESVAYPGRAIAWDEWDSLTQDR
ncbi:MAG: twin-arginine translocation pathway signal protein [Pseudomonadota bacterium]